MAKTHRKHRGGVEPLTVNTGAPIVNGAQKEPTLGNSGKKGFNFGPNLTVNPGEPKAPEAPTEPTLGNSGKNKFNFGPNTTGGKRKKSKTGGANPLEWFQGIFRKNNKALTSASNVQTHDIPEPEMQTTQPMQTMQLMRPNTSPIANEETPVEETTPVNPPMVNETFNNQAGGKRRKSKTRKHKKSHKRR